MQPNTPIPASLAALHRRTDMEGLLALLPILVEFPAGFTAAVLIQKAQERFVFPDLDEEQLAWKVRRSIDGFEKADYLRKGVHGWYIPEVQKITSECREAAQEIGRAIDQMNHQRSSLLQAALMGPGESPASSPRPAGKSTLKASSGLQKLAGKSHKEKK